MFKLPVGGTLRTAYGFVWTPKGAVLGYMLLPVVATAAISLIVAISEIGQIRFFNSYTGTRTGEPSAFQALNLFGPETNFDIFVGIAAIIVSSALYVMFAVAWHRRFLIGPEGKSIGAAFVWRQRHWRFTLLGILFAILMMAVGLITGLLTIPVTLLLNSIGNEIVMVAALLIFGAAVWIVIGLVAVGVLLAFPATAVNDDRIDFWVSQKMTAGNNKRILVILGGGVYLPFAVIAWLINWGLFGNSAENTITTALQGSVSLLFLALLMQQFVYYIGIACGVSCLSSIYRQFIDNTSVPEPVKKAPSEIPKPTGLPPGSGAI